ncbi:MAG: heme o synthase [Crocinitomicaceae bacterium]|nr:heme o synthase [Crocinitomicaceae bacterium]
MVGKKMKEYLVFTKFRLSFTVVLSALAGYLFNGGTDWKEILLLVVGGTLVTGASNGSNQIWERDLDKLMNRTKQRPLPAGTMSLKEAYIVVILFLVVGTVMLAMINLPSAILGVSAYVSYVFMYTPLKRKSPWAVFVGAFPGAIPPMLGAIAASGTFSLVPGVLFFIQFIWQFPHFWAIAWVVYDDYNAGGFSLLPSKSGKSKNSAFFILLYSLFLIPFSLIPWVLGWTGNISMAIACVLGALFYLAAYRLYQTLDTKDAKKLMFASIIYLPIIQFLFVFDRTDEFILQLKDVVEFVLK